MSAAMVASGFWSSSAVHHALIVGAVVALVAGPLGVFTVIRGQSFAGEALGDIGTTGGSGAALAGIATLGGFLIANVVASALMELAGVQRRRGRDVAIGVVLGGGLGLAALFLYLTTIHRTTNPTISILFGSLFAVQSSTIPLIVAFAAVVVALLALVGRPLLLASASPELAAARGVPVRLMGYLYLVAMSLSVALCALTIGTILSTALLIGPAATALRIVRRPWLALAAASGLGIACTWIGVLLAYDSYDWPPHQTGWPVSFFVVALVLVAYIASGAAGARGRRAVSPAADSSPPAVLGG